MISLRTAGPEDEAFLRDVYASTRAEEMALLDWDEATRSAFVAMQHRAQHEHYHANFPGAAYSIVLLNDVPVGRLYVDRGDTELRVLDITLLPPYRGRGMGTALLRGLLAEAAASGKAVALHVEPGNPARRLYQRLGFRVVAHDGLYWELRWTAAPEA